jgi:hypothetical protein
VNRALRALSPAVARLIATRRIPSRIREAFARQLRRADISLSELPTALLVGLARSDDPAQRALVSFKVTQELTPRSVLAAVNSDELVGPAVLLFDRVPAEPGERSAALHQAIVLDSASYPLRQHAAMLCVRRHPDEITTPHARAIVNRCLNLAAQPVDPYAPVPLAMAARTAAAALIARSPALDQQILDRLRSGPRARELALVQAAALQGRRREYSSGVAAALEALGPDERQALGFARDCDRQYTALDPAQPPVGRFERLSQRLRTPAVRFARPDSDSD